MHFCRSCVVFSLYVKNKGHNTTLFNAPFTLTLIDDADFAELKITREDLVFLRKK